MHTHLLRIAGREYKAEVKELTPERAVVVVDGKEYAVDLVRLVGEFANLQRGATSDRG